MSRFETKPLEDAGPPTPEQPRRRRRSGWFYGCGLGCALFLIAGLGLCGYGAFHTARMIQRLDHSVVAAAQQEERFGAPAAFTPSPDGAIPAPRMAAFLSVRDALEEPRKALIEIFETMPIGQLRDEDLEAMPLLGKLRTALLAGRSAAGMVQRVTEIYSVRDQAMLEAGIGMGEYAYIYTVVYYSWLGHDPEDGPRTDAREASEGASQEFRVQAGRVMARLRTDLIQILRNQLAALPPDTPAAWRIELEAEIARMEREERRSPWLGSVPAAIAASLEPHRLRLEASYNPLTNPFELARTRRTRRWSYTSE
jgi:hypothetical protein